MQRPYPVKRLSLVFQKGFLFYAEFNIRLFFLLLLTQKNTLFSNDLDTLLPNFIVSKMQGKELIFDSHELFSEVPELENRKFVKSVWCRIERGILPKLKKVITVSESISKHYMHHYGVQAVGIRNLPMEVPLNPEPFPFPIKNKKAILYQGSVNVGRGLELMIETIKLLDDFILIIIGAGDILEGLEQKILIEQLENKVKFLGKVLPNELKTFTPNANIGISLEEDLGLNYRYALPNKIFDYIQAEVPVIVSNLPEMKKLVDTYQIGEVLMKRSPEALAKLIRAMDQKNYSRQLLEAKKQLNWSKEKVKLIQLLQS